VPGEAILDGMTGRLSCPTFIGRTRELSHLDEALERAREGTPVVVAIGGEAGVGKTRLVDELVARSQATGATVLTGGCIGLGEDGVPFAPVVEALRTTLRTMEPEAVERWFGHARAALAGLLPELGAAGRAGDPRELDPATGQGRMFELLLGVLERLTAERSAVLVVEDLHWADHSTRDLLAFLIRNLRHGRLLLVLTPASPASSASPLASWRCSGWSPTAAATARSPRRCSSAPRRPACTCPTSWPSWGWRAGSRRPRSPTAWRCSTSRPGADPGSWDEGPLPWWERPLVGRGWRVTA